MHSVQSPRLRFNTMLKNALLYCLGWLYAGFSEWTLRTLLDDASPLAKALDQWQVPYDAASNEYFIFYMCLTTVCLWGFFTSFRQAYTRLENAPTGILLALCMMSLPSACGSLTDLIEGVELFFEVSSLIWQQTSMVKSCFFQFLAIYLILISLILLIPLRIAVALWKKCFKRNHTT